MRSLPTFIDNGGQSQGSFHFPRGKQRKGAEPGEKNRGEKSHSLIEQNRKEGDCFPSTTHRETPFSHVPLSETNEPVRVQKKEGSWTLDLKERGSKNFPRCSEGQEAKI